MATGTSRARMTTDDVMALLDDGDELDDCFAPGSDDELGFEEVQLAETEVTGKYDLIITLK